MPENERPRLSAGPPEPPAERRGLMGRGRGKESLGGSKEGRPRPFSRHARSVIPVPTVPVAPRIAVVAGGPAVVVVRVVVLEPVEPAVPLVHPDFLQPGAEPVVVAVVAPVVVDHADPVIAAEAVVPVPPPVVVVLAPVLPLLALVLVIRPSAAEPAVEANPLHVPPPFRIHDHRPGPAVLIRIVDDDPAVDRSAADPDVGADALRLCRSGCEHRAENQRADQQIESRHGVLLGLLSRCAPLIGEPRASLYPLVPQRGPRPAHFIT